MDKERLKLIVRNLELLVEGLKTEVYSDINSYNYENLPSKKKLDKVIHKTCRAELDNGIHVIVVQGKDGSLTIGNSHHYTHDTHYPFENETVDNLILNKFMGAIHVQCRCNAV